MTIARDRLFRIHVIIILTLLVLHFGQAAFPHVTGIQSLAVLLRLFDVNAEQSIGTVLSVSAWVALALAFAISRDEQHTRQANLGWLMLATAAIFFALDEALSFHEQFDTLMPDLLNFEKFELGGVNFVFIWPFFYLPTLAVIALLVLAPVVGAMKTLKPGQAAQLMIAGLIFLSGAAGTELVSSAMVAGTEWSGLVYNLLIMLEEGLEMLGVALAVRTMLGHLGGDSGSLKVIVKRTSIPED